MWPIRHQRNDGIWFLRLSQKIHMASTLFSLRSLIPWAAFTMGRHSAAPWRDPLGETLKDCWTARWVSDLQMTSSPKQAFRWLQFGWHPDNNFTRNATPEPLIIAAPRLLAYKTLGGKMFAVAFSCLILSGFLLQWISSTELYWVIQN